VTGRFIAQHTDTTALQFVTFTCISQGQWKKRYKPPEAHRNLYFLTTDTDCYSKYKYIYNNDKYCRLLGYEYVLVGINVSEEYTASTSTLKMEAECSSETFEATYQSMK
jgi:hypothetical protein